MIQIFRFKELKSILPTNISTKQVGHLQKWFSLAVNLKVLVFFDEKTANIHFQKDFGNGVVFKEVHKIYESFNKIYFSFDNVFVNNKFTKLPLQGVRLGNETYVVKHIKNPVELATMGENSPIVETFLHRNHLWQSLVKSNAFKKIRIKDINIYMCVDSSIGFNVGTVISENTLYDLWINPPQNEEGAKYLLNLLCENYMFSNNFKYIGDASKLTTTAIDRLYESEIQYLSCDSRGKFCSQGCTHTCLNDTKKYTKTKTKAVLLSLVKEYEKLISKS